MNHLHQWRRPRHAQAVAAILLTLSALLVSGCVNPMAHPVLSSWVEPDLPNTSAGRQFSAYLTTFNSGDRAALRQYIQANFTPVGPGGGDLNARIDSQLRLYDTSRGLNLYQITVSSEPTITVIVQFRLTQEWRRMTFMVEELPPNRVTGVMLEPIDAPQLIQQPSANNAAFGEQIDGYLRDLAAADRFSGVVLIAKDDELLFQRAYGLANKEQAVPNQVTTRFDLASAGKMFTAVAIAQLVDAGKLAYDAPIGAYMPEYPSAIGQRVTVEHLLTHRSGLADYFADPQRFETVRQSRDPQRDYPVLFLNEPLRFKPGERFEYSNSNYIVLGILIERVSGDSYAEYLQRHIFAPAGMTATSIAPDEIDDALRARRYTELDDQGRIRLGTRHLGDDLAPVVGSAAGGSYSTVGDLWKFDRALRTHKLLSPESTRILLTDRVNYERPGYRYGYGFIFRKTGTEWIAGHSGGFPGVDAQVDLYLDRGYSVIALANYEMVAEPVVKYIEQLLP